MTCENDRRRDVLCAGGCGKLLVGSSTSLPAGLRKCMPCRRIARGLDPARTLSSQKATRTFVPMTCQRSGCTKIFTPKRPGGMYCSQPCAWRARDAKPDLSRLCAICSTPLRRGQKRSELCCSRPCGDELQTRNGSRTRPTGPTGWAKAIPIAYVGCLMCDAVFTRRASITKLLPYCGQHSESDVAAHKYAQLLATARAARTPRPELERTCEECDEQFVTVHANARYCATKCSVRALRRKRKISEGRRAVSTGTRKAVYVRDNGQCHLCRHAVRLDVEDAHENTWAATLDHIVPHSQGGLDELDNLATAHRWCNTLRLDSPIEATRAALIDAPPPDHWDNAEWHHRRALIESYVAPLEVAA